jgi:hypothetical protein
MSPKDENDFAQVDSLLKEEYGLVLSPQNWTDKIGGLNDAIKE